MFSLSLSGSPAPLSSPHACSTPVSVFPDYLPYCFMSTFIRIYIRLCPLSHVVSLVYLVCLFLLRWGYDVAQKPGLIIHELCYLDLLLNLHRHLAWMQVILGE
ncbi:hypothetical protein AMECASPLE_002032 [Ameca splendens]|uniref:Uncharacterized protein n=1 Tax=Ameca splendens TaxID=208324 RepID=A0ABV0XY47_9TELE